MLNVLRIGIWQIDPGIRELTAVENIQGFENPQEQRDSGELVLIESFVPVALQLVINAVRHTAQPVPPASRASTQRRLSARQGSGRR